MLRSAPHRRRGVFGVALVDLRSLMGSRNVVETRWGNGGMEGRGEEGVKSRWRGGVGERGREGWKRRHRGWWTGVGENVGRRTLLDCLPRPSPPPPLPPPPSLKGGRARALHPPFANSSSRSIPFYRERCGGYRYTTITDTLTDDFVLYNLRLHIARPSFN